MAEPDSMTLAKNFEGEAFLKSLVRDDDIPPFPSSFNNYLAIYNLQSLSITINVQGDVKSWKQHQNFDVIAKLRQAIPLRIGQLIQMKGSRGGECQIRKMLK